MAAARSSSLACLVTASALVVVGGLVACGSREPDLPEPPDPAAHTGQVTSRVENYGNAWIQATCTNKVTGDFCIGYTIGHCADERPYGDACSLNGAGGPVNGPRECSQDESSTTYRCLHNWCAYGCVPGNSPPGYHDDNWVPVYTCGNSAACGPSYEGPPPVTPDAGPKPDATTCATEPEYPPSTSTDTGRLSLGYDLPDPAASWACAQLAAIPYVGQVLFSPTGGIGFTADAQSQETNEWKSTCREEISSSLGIGITVNICSLEAQGRWEKQNTQALQHCVNCEPPPSSCGDVACSEAIENQTRQASLTRTFSIPLGGGGGSSSGGCGGTPPSSRWLDWIRRHVNVSASVGGGWNGRSDTNARQPGQANCNEKCTACNTEYDKNSIFLQATGTASVSTPTWNGISGSAFVSLSGRVGVGREDQTSTCSPACGGYDADASITLRMGISAGAFGYRVGASVGYTCAWRNSWSSCPGAADNNRRECRWANATDP